MPWFRFTGEPRVTLRFRNGTCELWLANLGGEDGWAWVADKADGSTARVVLAKNPNMPALRETLTVSGFAVEAGGAAEKIMRAAVKKGHAEELPEDLRWRVELITARARARPADAAPAVAGRYSIYQLAEDFPRELQFRNGSCRLEFARGAMANEWVFRARKSVPPKFAEIASSRYGRLALETILRQGVAVREGTTAAQLLDRLVAQGYATKRVGASRSRHFHGLGPPV